jgi:hypothetical protein
MSAQLSYNAKQAFKKYADNNQKAQKHITIPRR